MRGIEHLHPELQDIAIKFLADCKKAGLSVLITETMRSKAEQNALYAKGRTAPGNIVTKCKYPLSPHCWGVAFDFCRNIKGREYDDSDGFFKKVGAIGKKHGLFWGGDFKSFVDKPHLEYAKYLPNNSVKTLIVKYGTPSNFITTWGKEDQEVITKTRIKLNGILKTVDVIQKDGNNFIKLQDLRDGKIEIGYDSANKLPIINAK